MTNSEFRIKLTEIKAEYSKGKMSGKKEFLDKCLEMADDLLTELNQIRQFDGQQDKVDIETICFNRSKSAIEDKNTSMVDLQIAKNMYDSASSNLDSYSDLVNEAKAQVQAIIDGVEVMKETYFKPKKPLKS